MTVRPVIDVATPPGGWGIPWPNVAEIEGALSHKKWTLVGGLMAQLRAIHSGIDAIRPTNDVDIVLHVETTRGVVTAAASALEGLGYSLSPSFDPREQIAHRFTRGEHPTQGRTSSRSAGPARRSGLMSVQEALLDRLRPGVVQ